jgi:hypothetical protein
VRRIASLFGALVLIASLAGSSLASGTVPKNSFTGDFTLLSDDGSVVLGHATVSLFPPTDQRLVPGSYDFKGASTNPIGIRESHAQIGQSGFWLEEKWGDEWNVRGANVAFGAGVECVYIQLNNADCHPFAVMFVDPLDPTLPRMAAFANSTNADGSWNFQYWQMVGKGDFVLKFSGTES